MSEFLQHCLNALMLGGTYALLGIGLIGSSIAHAMRRAGLAAHVSGYDKPEVLERWVNYGTARR